MSVVAWFLWVSLPGFGYCARALVLSFCFHNSRSCYHSVFQEAGIFFLGGGGSFSGFGVQIRKGALTPRGYGMRTMPGENAPFTPEIVLASVL
jgi:hypothetical protein